MDSGVFIVGIVFGVVYINFLQRVDVTDMFFWSVYAETFGIDLSSTTAQKKPKVKLRFPVLRKEYNHAV